jgi:hypothetical protein
LEEQRVAGAPLGECRELVVAQRPPRGRADERLRIVHRQRLEPEAERRQRRVSLCGRETAVHGRLVVQASHG